LAFVPFILVAVTNKYLSTAIKEWYPNGFDLMPLDLQLTPSMLPKLLPFGQWV
jgi:hypothetical protein